MRPPQNGLVQVALGELTNTAEATNTATVATSVINIQITVLPGMALERMIKKTAIK